MANSLYTNELREQVRISDWPRTLAYRIVEYTDELRFVLYRDNINSLTHDEKFQLASTLGNLLRRVNEDGIPIYTRVKAGSGKHDCEFEHNPECKDGCIYV